ncbi:MAG: flagellar biosynthesis protein FlgN [Roseovarius sp.]|nr:flagellar biosynthesis protein FlgN [Roseovarius sp.]
MTHRSRQNAADRLDRLLDRERAALLEGDLTAIAGFADTKESLVAALGADPETARGSLPALQRKMARNQSLLEAAAQGIRKVADRLSAVESVRTSLQTYDRTGRRTRFDGKRGSEVEKRA